MTIFDAVRKEDLWEYSFNWGTYESGAGIRSRVGTNELPTIKAISLEDLRKEIEGMPIGFSIANFGKNYICREYLLKKLEEK